MALVKFQVIFGFSLNEFLFVSSDFFQNWNHLALSIANQHQPKIMWAFLCSLALLIKRQKEKHTITILFVREREGVCVCVFVCASFCFNFWTPWPIFTKLLWALYHFRSPKYRIE
jgi:hypothetical protein